MVGDLGAITTGAAVLPGDRVGLLAAMSEDGKMTANSLPKRTASRNDLCANGGRQRQPPAMSDTTRPPSSRQVFVFRNADISGQRPPFVGSERDHRTAYLPEALEAMNDEFRKLYVGQLSGNTAAQ